MSREHDEAVRLVKRNFPECGADNDDVWLLRHGFKPVNSDLDKWTKETEYEPEPLEMIGVHISMNLSRGFEKGPDTLRWKASQTYVDEEGMSRYDGPFRDTPEEALVALYEMMIDKGV